MYKGDYFIIKSETILLDFELKMIKDICFKYAIIYNKYRDRIIEKWHYPHINANYILNEEKLDIDDKIIEALVDNIREWKSIETKKHINIYSKIGQFRAKNVKIENDYLQINEIGIYFDQFSNGETDRKINWGEDVCYAKLVKFQLIDNRLIATINTKDLRIRKKGKH